MPTLFVQAGLHDPDIRFARYDAAYDEVQQEFSDAAGFAGDDLKTTIEDNEAQIEAAGVPVASYISPGHRPHHPRRQRSCTPSRSTACPSSTGSPTTSPATRSATSVCVDCQNPADA